METDNELKEQALTQEETAPKPKKPSKKKQQPATEQTAPEPETSTIETDNEHDGATVQTTSEQENPNWNWYNQLQNVQPKSSNGGSNHTHSVRRNAQKRARKARTQKASRRINRK
jgi:glucan-binding YG repeat protein